MTRNAFWVTEKNWKTQWGAVSKLRNNQFSPEFGAFIRDKKGQLVFLCLHIRAFFPCIPPLMTCSTENAVGKIPGRCQLSSMKCGNKLHFFICSFFSDSFFLFVCSLRFALVWMCPSFMNRNRPFNVSGSFPLCCTGGERMHFVVSVNDSLFWSAPPPRDHTETIPTILPCSRQCWRRTEMEARAAKRTQVCRRSDGKRSGCFQATAGPAPQNLWMRCECGNFPKCLSHRHRSFFKRFQWKIEAVERAGLKAKMLYVCIFKIDCLTV